MKSKSVLLILLLSVCVFVFAACQQKTQQDIITTQQVSTVVNNIYITDDGVFAQQPQTQMQPVAQATTQQVLTTQATEPATTQVQTTTQVVMNIADYTPQMILDEIMTAVNLAKEQQNFSAHLLQEVSITLTDCTLSWAVPVINAAISAFIGPHENEYTFVNGISPDPKEDFKTTVTPMGAIPPSDRLFALEIGGVVDAAAFEENGEYVFTVTLAAESTDAQTTVPYYHAQALDYLNLSDFDFGIGEITDSNCNYPGATVTIRTLPDGTLLKYEETIPMNGSGTGKLGISLSASFEGYMYECWTFDW